MADDLKNKILSFLRTSPNHKFIIKEISEQTGISYPTVLKWIDVLRAENLIIVHDYGNVKLVEVVVNDA